MDGGISTAPLGVCVGECTPILVFGAPSVSRRHIGAHFHRLVPATWVRVMSQMQLPW